MIRRSFLTIQPIRLASRPKPFRLLGCGFIAGPNHRSHSMEDAAAWVWSPLHSLGHSRCGRLQGFHRDQPGSEVCLQRTAGLGWADAYGDGKGGCPPDQHGYDHFGAYGFDGGDTGMFLAKACQGFDLVFWIASSPLACAMV